MPVTFERDEGLTDLFGNLNYQAFPDLVTFL